MSASLRAIAVRRLRFLPQPLFAMVMHAVFQGEFSTLRRPRTYAQLLGAKNLRAHDPLLSLTADKYAVRSYVTERVGETHLIPLIQLVRHPAEIDFAALSGPCVMKATHGCDMTILLPRGSSIDAADITLTVQRWFATNYYRSGWRELHYRDLPPRVVIEQFIGDGMTPPTDYKLFMFGGQLGLIEVHQGRFACHTTELLTPDWDQVDVRGAYPAPLTRPTRPANFAAMVAVAQRLSRGFDFVRVDLYNVQGRIYFGEITHFPGGGLVRLRPREFDRALGELWRHGTPIPARFLKDG